MILALALHQLKYEQKSYWRNPASAAFTFAFPVMFLVIFASLNIGATIDFLGGLNYNQYYVPGIICFGVILQGKTSHAQNIAEAVSGALALLQVQARRPIIHGVLHFENEEQAQERCFGKKHNRGIEAARTAKEMVSVFRELRRFSGKREKISADSGNEP